MPGPFQGIGTVSTALRAFQRGLDVVGHNIANVNTPGYTRQITTFRTAAPTDLYTASGIAALGNGVRIDSIISARDLVLEGQAGANAGAYGRSAAYTAALTQIEGVYGEPSANGIAAALGAFFDAWSGLGSNPSEPANRLQVRNAAETLTSRIRTAYSEMDRISEHVSASATEVIERVDLLAKEVAKLNLEIARFSTSTNRPNDLIDQRTLMLQEMSSLVGANWREQKDGTVTVYAGGAILVEGQSSRPLPSTIDASAGTLTDGVITIPIRSGQLAGHMDALAQMQGQQQMLNELANSLRADINGVHQTGINALGQTGIHIFDESSTGAEGFRLSDQVLANADAIAAGVSGSAGDGGLALSISDRRDQALAALGGKGFESFFQNAIVRLGSEVSHQQTTSEALLAVGQQIESQRQSIGGVSLDEEMTDMMRLQRSYQAAARALTVFDEVTEDLLGIIR